MEQGIQQLHWIAKLQPKEAALNSKEQFMRVFANFRLEPAQISRHTAYMIVDACGPHCPVCLICVVALRACCALPVAWLQMLSGLPVAVGTAADAE